MSSNISENTISIPFKKGLVQIHALANLDLGGASANFSQYKKSSGGGNQYLNNNRGQFQRDRGKINRNRNALGRRNINSPVCQVCGKLGHIALKCYYRFDLSYQDNFDNQNSNESGNGAQQHQAYIATPVIVHNEAWCMDSSATNHVTSKSNNLGVKADKKGKAKLSR